MYITLYITHKLHNSFTLLIFSWGDAFNSARTGESRSILVSFHFQALSVVIRNTSTATVILETSSNS